jgi:hypothetical protein
MIFMGFLRDLADLAGIERKRLGLTHGNGRQR